jgi:hypothetical protein
MKLSVPKPEYVEQAQSLTRDEAERVFARMRGRLSRVITHERISPLDAVALQLEYEDEQLAEWRANLDKLRKKHEGKKHEGK